MCVEWSCVLWPTCSSLLCAGDLGQPHWAGGLYHQTAGHCRQTHHWEQTPEEVPLPTRGQGIYMVDTAVPWISCFWTECSYQLRFSYRLVMPIHPIHFSAFSFLCLSFHPFFPSFLLLSPSSDCDADERGSSEAAAQVEGGADGHTSNDGNAHPGRVQLRWVQHLLHHAIGQCCVYRHIYSVISGLGGDCRTNISAYHAHGIDCRRWQNL